MRGPVLSLVAFALLAGCASPDPQASGPEPGPSIAAPTAGETAREGAQAQRFSQGLDAKVSYAMANGFGYLMEACVDVDAGAGVEIVQGFANATWSSPAPGPLRLQVSLHGEEVASSSGASPLSVPFSLAAMGTALRFTIGPTEESTGALAEQDVRLDLDFLYHGAPVTAAAADCVS